MDLVEFVAVVELLDLVEFVALVELVDLVEKKQQVESPENQAGRPLPIAFETAP